MTSQAQTVVKSSPVRAIVAELMRRARAAQKIYERCSQDQLDEVVTAVGWAIMEPGRNRLLA